jgi:PIN domain nuclease of toxin-antitoxin system
MNLVLDAHALLWWLAGNPKLSKNARAALENTSNQVYISVASLWEMSIKHAAGKLPEFSLLAHQAESIVSQQGFLLLPIFYQHAFIASQLPSYHRDPFDRLLIAIAQKEDMHLISKDSAFDKYEVKVLW